MGYVNLGFHSLRELHPRLLAAVALRLESIDAPVLFGGEQLAPVTQSGAFYRVSFDAPACQTGASWLAAKLLSDFCPLFLRPSAPLRERDRQVELPTDTIRLENPIILRVLSLIPLTTIDVP